MQVDGVGLHVLDGVPFGAGEADAGEASADRDVNGNMVDWECHCIRILLVVKIVIVVE